MTYDSNYDKAHKYLASRYGKASKYEASDCKGKSVKKTSGGALVSGRAKSYENS